MTAILYLDPTSRPRNASGQVMPFATLTFIRSGTEQILATYTADAAGEFATITPDFEAYTYRVQLREANGVLRYDVDPYLPFEGQTEYYDAQVQALADGEIVAGAEMTFDEDGVKYDIFADAELKHPLPNPVQADASGLYPRIYREAADDPPPLVCDSNMKIIPADGPDGIGFANPDIPPANAPYGTFVGTWSAVMEFNYYRIEEIVVLDGSGDVQVTLAPCAFDPTFTQSISGLLTLDGVPMFSFAASGSEDLSGFRKRWTFPASYFVDSFGDLTRGSGYCVGFSGC